MKELPTPDSEHTMHALREGIKAKYRHYHQIDRDRFPDFTYNTNRANYKPLQASFREEFYVVRGLDQDTDIIHIPSTNTLALLFTDDNYVPGKKLFDTCQAYVLNSADVPEVTSDVRAPGKQSITLLGQPAKTPMSNKGWLIAGAGMLLAGILFFLLFNRRFFAPAPSGLVIISPTQKSLVPQELVIRGYVANAGTVWLAVRYEKGDQYWIQPGVKVQDDGAWFGVIHIGAVSSDHTGLVYQVRAFVNPTKNLTNGEIYHSWPEAELSTETVAVIRK